MKNGFHENLEKSVSRSNKIDFAAARSLRVSAQTLGEIVGTSDRTIQNRAKDNHISKPDSDGYPLIDCLKGYFRYENAQDNKKKSGGPAGSDIDHEIKIQIWRERKARADKLSGEWLYAPRVSEAFTALTGSIKGEVMGAGRTFISEVRNASTDAEAEQIYRRAMADVLDRLSREPIYDNQLADSVDSIEPSGSDVEGDLGDEPEHT